MIVVISPRTGAPGTEATGSIDLPSKVATPSSVPSQSTPSLSCASAITDDCGSPRQLDLLNVRNARVGVNSAAAAIEQTRVATAAMMDRERDMEFSFAVRTDSR